MQTVREYSARCNGMSQNVIIKPSCKQSTDECKQQNDMSGYNLSNPPNKLAVYLFNLLVYKL